MKYDDIRRLLPDVYQRSLTSSKPLDAVLHVIQGLFEPSERILDHVDTYFNPYTTPERFVRYLAGWVDMERYLPTTGGESGLTNHSPPAGSIEPGRLRELIANAAQLSQWRGTARGLKLFLEIATGVAGFQLDESMKNENGEERIFHLRIRAPQAALSYQQLITNIVNGEKPAYVTYEIEFKEAASGE